MRSARLGLMVAILGGLACGSPEAPAPQRIPRVGAGAPADPTAADAADSAHPAPDTAAAAPASAVPSASASAATAVGSTPVPASASASVPAPPPAPALGPFDRAALPRTKLALIEAVDAALRQRSPELLGKLWLDHSLFGQLCPGVDEAGRARMQEEQRQRRERAAESFQECLALGDWAQTKRLVLNYGSRTSRLDDACSPQLLEHEDSELFYALGDTVLKVKIYDAIAFGGGHALAQSIRCSKKKPGSAVGAESDLRRLGQRCPHLPWPAFTQIRDGCPRL